VPNDPPEFEILEVFLFMVSKEKDPLTVIAIKNTVV
jgi:hypothetical protein